MKKFFILFLLMMIPLFSQAEELPSYKKVLKKYHRHGEHYSLETLGATFVWDVVYKSKEWRASFVEELAQKYRLSDEEKSKKLREEMDELSKGEDFVVVLYTDSKKLNRLENPESSLKIQLETENEVYEPSEIKRIKPISPKEEFFYPFLKPWNKVYLVSFPPHSVSGKEFSLTLLGLKGAQTLQWKGLTGH